MSGRGGKIGGSHQSDSFSPRKSGSQAENGIKGGIACKYSDSSRLVACGRFLDGWHGSMTYHIARRWSAAAATSPPDLFSSPPPSRKAKGGYFLDGETEHSRSHYNNVTPV